MAHHFALIKENNTIGQYRLKQWIRQNLNQVAEGINPDIQTSHEVRRQLINSGWQIRFADNEVYLIKPDELGHFEYANAYVSEIEEDEEIEDYVNEQAAKITFSLERDLQKAIRLNINMLESGLKIIDNGKERVTEAGRIDITAKDDKNRIVIIELKAIDAKPEVIAQTLSYMQAVQTEEKGEVRGIIVASDFSNRVKLAARQIENIKLVKYSFQFTYDLID